MRLNYKRIQTLLIIMQNLNRNNFKGINILCFFLLLSGLCSANSWAGEKLQLFYGNDIRSELEACG